MQYQNMSDDQLVDELVNELVQYIVESAKNGETYVLASYFRDGFRGFKNYSREDLLDECRAVFGADDEEDAA